MERQRLGAVQCVSVTRITEEVITETQGVRLDRVLRETWTQTRVTDRVPGDSLEE